MKKLIKLIFGKILFKVEYKNIENLKDIKKCLICPNHSSVFDPTFIYPVVENLYIMAKSEIFKNKIVNRILKHYNVFPVNRNKTDAKSLFFSLDIFEKNENAKLLIFPEGRVIKSKNEMGKQIKKRSCIYSIKCKYTNYTSIYYKKTKTFFKSNSNIWRTYQY